MGWVIASPSSIHGGSAAPAHRGRPAPGHSRIATLAADRLGQRCPEPLAAREGILPVIRDSPNRQPLHPFDPEQYKRRKRVKGTFCRIKDFRRIAIRQTRLQMQRRDRTRRHHRVVVMLFTGWQTWFRQMLHGLHKSQRSAPNAVAFQAQGELKLTLGRLRPWDVLRIQPQKFPVPSNYIPCLIWYNLRPPSDQTPRAARAPR